jgi:hypothetical protein
MPRTALDEVMMIADIIDVLEGRCFRIGVRRSFIQKSIDGRRDEFHMPHLFRRDGGHELVEGSKLLLGLHGDGLVEVVVEGRHFAEPPAEQLLHGRGGIGVELGRRRQFYLEFVDAQEHGTSSVSMVTAPVSDANRCAPLLTIAYEESGMST